MKSRSGGSSLFSLSCGCNDSKSVSVSASDGSDRSTTPAHRPGIPSSAETLTLTSFTTTSSSASITADEGPIPSSFSDLLRQLSDLERSVIELGPPESAAEDVEEQRRRHRRWRSDSGVAVVTETKDPLGDFRRSMLQMIVEKEIVGGEELRRLLARFLAINSPCHHDLILRAFAEIWADVFAGRDRTPNLRRRSSARFPARFDYSGPDPTRAGRH